MDIKKLESAIEKIFADLTPPNYRLGSLEYNWIFDTSRHHYQLLLEGWDANTRILEILVQIDVKNNLVWLQEDNTDYGVAEALVNAGIPKESIVLGFHAPYKRPYTGFATGE